MSDPTFRPKYVSFDCYGTLINWPMTPITKELVGHEIPAEQWDQFVAQCQAGGLRAGLVAHPL
jgi:2-haloacid dehalogenase